MKAIKISDRLYSQLADIAKKEGITLGAAAERLFRGVTHEESSHKVTTKRTKAAEERAREIVKMKLKEVKRRFPFCPDCGSILYEERVYYESGTAFSPFKCWRCGKQVRVRRSDLMS